LAISSTDRSTPTIHLPGRLNRFSANSPSPVPVARAVRSHISCTAAMRGYVRRAAQRNDRPYFDPAWAYVAIPEGSSSEAPVMSPGPIARRYSRSFVAVGTESRAVFVEPCLRRGGGGALITTSENRQPAKASGTAGSDSLDREEREFLSFHGSVLAQGSRPTREPGPDRPW
jgi:hypothetical protein